MKLLKFRKLKEVIKVISLIFSKFGIEQNANV